MLEIREASAVGSEKVGFRVFRVSGSEKVGLNDQQKYSYSPDRVVTIQPATPNLNPRP